MYTLVGYQTTCMLLIRCGTQRQTSLNKQQRDTVLVGKAKQIQVVATSPAGIHVVYEMSVTSHNLYILS